jgi:drug/metabolite transporter (DMT)-like permease
MAVMAASGAVAQLLLIRAFMVAEAGAIAPFGYAGLIYATFWGILLFGEWPPATTWIGALVIVGAGLYVWRREARGRRTA